MPFALLMTEYMKRLEARDPRLIGLRDGIINLWRTIGSYLIAHRGREWWEVGCH
jgi:hypothetical protein